jgi:hypothetical protein
MSQLLTPYIFLLAVVAIVLLGRAKRTRLEVAVLVLSAFWLRLSVADRPYLNEWDERYHALVAWKLIEQPLKPMLYRHTPMAYDYKSWGSSHIWVHKPPPVRWSIDRPPGGRHSSR